MMMAFIDRLQPAPVGGGFSMDDYWVWCGSVIRGEDGRYHMFASRWPRTFPFFEGYVIGSEVVRAVSDRPEGPYRFAEVVLGDRGEGFWDGRMTHNPTIHKAGDTYLLYYIGATFAGPRPTAEQLVAGDTSVTGPCYSTIRIGLATAGSVFGPWRRQDRPVLEPRPGKWDERIVTNPAPCVLEDGRVLLLYRSNVPGGLRLGAAMAEGYDGPFRRLSDEPVLVFEGGNFVEDPYVWRRGGRFELLAKDMTGGLTGEKHAGIHGWSRDGVDWRLSEPPKAYSRRVRWSDGRVTEQGCLERPQLLIEGGRPTHLFAATGDGPGGFRLCSRTWNVAIPVGEAE